MHTVTPTQLDNLYKESGLGYSAKNPFLGLFVGAYSPDKVASAIAVQKDFKSEFEELSEEDKKAYQRLIQEAIARCCKEFGEANKPEAQAVSLEADKENILALNESTYSQKSSGTQQRQPLQKKSNQQTPLLRYKPLSFSNSAHSSIQPSKTTIPASQATPKGGNKTTSPNNGAGHK